MSTRAIRRLCGDENFLIPGVSAWSSSEEEVIPVSYVKSKRKKDQHINPFKLLDCEDSQSDGKEVDDDNGVEKSKEKDEAESDAEVVNCEEQEVARKKNKRKRKKRGKKTGNEAADVNNEKEDEVDKGIREANESLQATNLFVSRTSHAAGLCSPMKPLLSVDHKHLNPDNEMKKIFGAHVVKNDIRQSRKQRFHRSTWLTSPKASWPSISRQGLSMEKQNSKGDCTQFTYQHSKEYQQVQFKFLDAVESLNPNNIMELVRLHPYHIDSLLQLSEICRMSEDTAMAVELIERALYSCENSFHPMFNLTQANCLLDYRHPENRCLFIALFKHIQFVGLRGCNRTALELCKLLLSLNPDEDPLGVLLMIDYYAIKSEQYSFLKRFYDELEIHKNLYQLPNHAFSVAMTNYYLSKDSKETMGEADEMLQNALMMFPLVLLPLLEKCGIQSDTIVANHPMFAVQTNESPALCQLVSLFIARNYALWKEADIAEWLERNVKEVLKHIESDQNILDQYKEKRKLRYKHAPRNIFRHIIMSELKDVTVSLPPELSNVPLMSFDPLPPKDSFISYERPVRRNMSSNTTWMSEFFRSMIPSYTPPIGGDHVAELNDNALVDDIGAVGGVGGCLADTSDIRRGVNAVMNSMRELLNNLQPNENEQDNDMEEVD